MSTTIQPILRRTPELGAVATPEAWDDEFLRVRSIPSSTRVDPSHAVLQYFRLLDLGDAPRVMDVGTGNGRHAVFFAEQGSQVWAIDGSSAACNLTRTLARERGVQNSIHVVEGQIADVANRLPHDGDLVLDAYVSCHIISPDALVQYLRTLRLLLRPGGWLLSIHFSVHDEFYAPLARAEVGQILATDPTNGITKHLYRRDELLHHASKAGTVVYDSDLRFVDQVHGRPYRRSILTLAIR